MAARTGATSGSTSIPLVRCRLDGSEDQPDAALRYIPAAEFELWRHLMETRHGRSVAVEDSSVWVPEGEDLDPRVDVEALEPVVRIEFDKPTPDGLTVPVRRFFRGETYPDAKAALLAHYDRLCRWSVSAVPGYFVPAASAVNGRVEATTLPVFGLDDALAVA